MCSTLNMAHCIAVSILLLTLKLADCDADFLIGRGIADATGLVAEGLLYGYARPDQDARGLHMRQYSRAFIIQDKRTNHRVVLSVTDVTMITTEVHLEVMEQLQTAYGGLYNDQNVLLTAQHSHSTPGGYQAYEVYLTPVGGFINETFDALVNGILVAIRLAHEDIKPGNVLVNHGILLNTTINRSLPAYRNNPADELSKYSYDVDNEMTVLKFTDANNIGRAIISFFPVHTTSLRNTNHYVSSDNKGYASQMFERDMNPGMLPSQGDFVAAFAQTAEGDVTPHIAGAFCNETNTPCDYLTSTCEDRNVEWCHGRGPGETPWDDLRIIGDRQYRKAKELYEGSTEMLASIIDSRMQYVNMTDVKVTVDGKEVPTCNTALGHSFAAGATDGNGFYPFYQGNLVGDADIDAARDLLFGAPSDVIKQCHAPKPILLQTGELQDDNENPWHPIIVPLQIVRIGRLWFLGVPAEVTTMAGRRLSERVKNVLVGNGLPGNTKVVVVALSNCYSHYITTKEEYAIQRYEGACTIYGPNTLEAYILKFSEMADNMVKGISSERGKAPSSLRRNINSALPPVRPDTPPNGRQFGDVLVDVVPEVSAGSSANVVFVSGNPRNNLLTNSTFLEVQRQDQKTWKTVYTDAHWETRFTWDRECINDNTTACPAQQQSNATITWDIPANELQGTYRILHRGYARLLQGSVSFYSGMSSSFKVEARV